MSDVFISYRRKDAETVAFLLFKDLTQLGYSVFYDHKTLGSGDFKQGIRKNIKEATDIIVIFSESSFGTKIYQDDDIYAFELKMALKYKKHIIGIMLEDFIDFPNALPKEIESIRYINCIKLYMAYYEAMFARLTSGMFLCSVSRLANSAPTNIAINSNVPEELKSLAELPVTQRMDSIQILLRIMDSFNSSPICMRFYQYIDLYDRNYGKEILPEYAGVIPTDLVTYLSFFETLYIIVASKTIDLSVIDFAYRFRFFAGCNNPLMQKSELLPLGYQYPNIMSFYNLWCEYIVNRYDHSQKCEMISDQIPMYEHDLHKKYAAYTFSKNPGIGVKIRFLNHNLKWLPLTMKTINITELQMCMDMQEEMLAEIEDNEVSNLFEPLTKEEMQRALKSNSCIGLYDGDGLIAQMNLILQPIEEENLLNDLNDKVQARDPAILDYVIVRHNSRGYSIQKTLLYVAECIAINNQKAGICAVTSPLNVHSIKNFISQEYKIIATQKKYRSIRHYLWKALDNDKIVYKTEFRINSSKNS